MGHWNQSGLWPWSPSHPAQPRTAPEAQERSPSSQVTGTQDPRAKTKPTLSPWTALNLDLRTSHLGWGEGARGLSPPEPRPSWLRYGCHRYCCPFCLRCRHSEPSDTPGRITGHSLWHKSCTSFPEATGPGTWHSAQGTAAMKQEPPLLGFFSVIHRSLVNGFVPDLPGMTFVEGTRTGQLVGLHGMRAKRDRHAPSSPLPSPPPRREPSRKY